MDYAPDLSLTNPAVLVGLFIGAMLTFVFAALTMSAVQRAAQSIVVEVRRQFREIAGIMEGTTDPDYASCVGLCTKGALREMVKPSLLAIIVPIFTGLILSVEGVVGLLGGVSVSGFAVAVFMSNAGGAWDNAKKYIESGQDVYKRQTRKNTVSPHVSRPALDMELYVPLLLIHGNDLLFPDIWFILA